LSRAFGVMRWMGGLRPFSWLWVREHVGSVSGFRICHGGYLVFFSLTSASNAVSEFKHEYHPAICMLCRFFPKIALALTSQTDDLVRLYNPLSPHPIVLPYHITDCGPSQTHTTMLPWILFSSVCLLKRHHNDTYPTMSSKIS